MSIADFPTIPAFPDPATASSLEEAILLAVREARAACALQGDGSKECAVAWDIVEELQAERCHREAHKNSLERYCDENPDAPECRIYDI